MEINKIYNENCLDVMSVMPDNFIDLTVTSPPYDGLREYNGYSFQFELIAKELYRVTKKGGIVVWVGSESGTSFKQALFFREVGFNLHDTMIYQKINYVPLTHNRYEQCFEYMFILSKGKPKTFNPIMMPCKYPGKVEKYGLDRRQNHGANHSMRLYDNTEFKAVVGRGDDSEIGFNMKYLEFMTDVDNKLKFNNALAPVMVTKGDVIRIAMPLKL